MMTRQYDIELTQRAIAECREQIQEYVPGEYERQDLQDELAAMVYELNLLLGMTDEEYADEHGWGD